MKINSITPLFIVNNIQESIDFYKDVLGFTFIMGIDDDKELYLEYQKEVELGFAIVQNSNFQIMFQAKTNIAIDLNQTFDTDKKIDNNLIYIEIEGFDKYYEDIKDKVKIVNEPRNTFYGMKEFFIRDNNDNIICFAEKLI